PRRACGGAGDRGNQLCWSSNRSWLACTERDDATNRIVGRNPNGHPVAWNHFDAEAAHAAAQLREHLMAGVTLHAVEPAAVDRHDRALHVDQVVLAQIASNPFSRTILTQTRAWRKPLHHGGMEEQRKTLRILCVLRFLCGGAGTSASA